MKLLVLALCVCAASAASFGKYKPFTPYQPQQVAKKFGQTVVAPVATAAEAVVIAPVVAANAAYGAAEAVVNAPVSAAKTVYNTGKELYYNGNEGEAAIVRSDSEVNPDGFNFYYETSNGIAAQAVGVTKKVDNEDVVAIQGSYKYVAPDGTPVEFSYVADENGYQPQSNLLPVGPPIPEAIIRSLEYIRAHPAKPENY